MVVVRKLKDKCKDAARMRREKERAEFVELSRLLPLPGSTTSQLDKASVIRLTSSYLRMRSAFPEGLGEDWGTRGRRCQRVGRNTGNSSAELTCRAPTTRDQPHAGSVHSSLPASGLQPGIRELGSLILQTLDGFVFALHRDGKIMYISETASVLLGLPQIDLTGSSVFEYIHPADRADIQAILSLNELDQLEVEAQLEANIQEAPHETVELRRSFCMRMKCILPKRNAGLVSNGYKAIHCSGYLKARRARAAAADGPPATHREPRPVHINGQPVHDTHSVATQGEWVWESYALVAVGHSLLPSASTEVRLGTSTFMFRANLDLRLYYVETTLLTLLGYTHAELVGRSLYQFVHVADLTQLELAHRQILDKGQAVSRYYRLMRRDGGHIWIQTNGTLINNPRSMPKPQHIVGICCVIGHDHADQSRSLAFESAALTDLPVASNQEKPAIVARVKLNSTSLAKQSNKKTKLLVGALQTTASRSNGASQGKSNVKRTRKSISGGSTINAVVGYPNRNSSQANNIPQDFQRDDQYSTMGSLRRPSDDTCSVVSSIASTMSAASTSSASGFGSASANGSANGLLSSCLTSSSSMLSSDNSSANVSSCPYLHTVSGTHTQSCTQLTPPNHSINLYHGIPNTEASSNNVGTYDYWLLTSSVHHDAYRESPSLQTRSNKDCQSFEQQLEVWPVTSSVNSAADTGTSHTSADELVSSSPLSHGLHQDIIYSTGQYDSRSSDVTAQQDNGYYYDNCITAYHSDNSIYMDTKDTRMPNDYVNNSDNVYQYHQYQLPQGPACLSGQPAS